ncbi:MFS transporter [Halioglobus japonicus]|uniref:Glycoside transporter n=1 Tax=Halioglobus japonicus TaxID=930805 RepID=A0AAP8MET5_9GAMM|nr:MFS transporter [Halioglobus japonicus]PLW86530.1 glycoside transporter [Halioglobus japonicus]GHD12397.1 MFS transporter [Halioglobus japonicus]
MAVPSLGMRLSYGVGQLSDGVKQSAFSTFLFFYYNQVLGLSGSLAGLAALMALMVDAITDPMVGQVSDRFRSRWGRRHPFMLAGAIPFGIAILMLFSPPDELSQLALFAWMLGGAIAVRLMLTLFYVPHLSLGAELATDYYGRTSLIGYRVFFTYAGILVTSVVGFSIFFPPTESFPNGMLNAASYPGFGMFCGVLGSVAMLISVNGTWRSIPRLSQPVHTANERSAWLAFIDVFRTLRQASFRTLFTAILVFCTLAGIVQTLLIYVATYVFEFQPEHLAGLASSVLVGILFASLVAQGLSRRFDKRWALNICVVTGGVFAFSPQVLYFGGYLETISTELKFVLIFSLNGMSHIFFIAYMILLDSMLSDCIDEHQLNSGKREEGLFFAARSFATKASYGLGSFFAGVGLDIIRFPQSANPESVPQEAVTSLAIFSGPVMFILFVATVAISSRYPMTEARHREIMRQIEAG